ncbi:hypothetical protein GWK48_07675 [Metallosphaera tengchongensis]|uniref:Uncharacterized protein n=1 Tax=Metallosphaera tengchongensis TaxID=1532350 RepID=A0A6N0NXC8_9CREN|nr:DUF5658 family protein [Metallosphaera tengchongensis]QKR00269.1 hypothetical protein GWK48_07675 [Metallosphaera tengchongensis]
MKEKVILPILSGLGLMDVVTTFLGVTQGYTEQNFFLSSFQDNPLLLVSIMSVLKVFAIVVSVLLARRSITLPSLVLIGLFGLADISNLLLLLH